MSAYTLLMKLSAVMIAGDIRDRAGHCLKCLLAQTALADMEIVVVDVSAADQGLAACQHPAVRCIRRPDLQLYSEAQAECVRQSTGDLVAFIEDHCYPEPGWAAALIGAFGNPDVALVTYTFVNHNPGHYVSRAFFIAEYGRWMAPIDSGEIHIPTCNNIAYRKSWLEPYRNRLEQMFEAEYVMHREMIGQGGVSWQESGARVAHENWLSFRDGLKANNAMRRVNAARRAELGGWGAARRLFYACAMLAAPALHLFRLARSVMNRPSLWGQFLAGLPVSISMYTTTSLEEARGYLFGPGNSRESFRETELNIERSRN